MSPVEDPKWFEWAATALSGIFSALFWRHADRLKLMEGKIAAMERTGDSIKADLRQMISEKITEAHAETAAQIHGLRSEIKQDLQASTNAAVDRFAKLDAKLDTLIFRGLK
jgi:hypothetical protein